MSLRVGVIGAGAMADTHVRAWRALEVSSGMIPSLSAGPDSASNSRPLFIAPTGPTTSWQMREQISSSTRRSMLTSMGPLSGYRNPIGRTGFIHIPRRKWFPPP